MCTECGFPRAEAEEADVAGEGDALEATTNAKEEAAAPAPAGRRKALAPRAAAAAAAAPGAAPSSEALDPEIAAVLQAYNVSGDAAVALSKAMQAAAAKQAAALAGTGREGKRAPAAGADAAHA